MSTRVRVELIFRNKTELRTSTSSELSVITALYVLGAIHACTFTISDIPILVNIA